MPSGVRRRRRRSVADVRVVWGWQLVRLAVIVPFIDAAISAHWWTSLPLAVKADGGNLLHLAYANLAGRFGRILLSMLPTEHIIASAVPTLAAQTISAIAVVSMYRESTQAMIINVFVICCMAQRGISVATISQAAHSRDTTGVLLSRYMRIYEGSFTLGYCLGVLAGGVLYDFGPFGPQQFSNCLAMAAVLSTLQLVLSVSIPEVRVNFWRSARRLRSLCQCHRVPVPPLPVVAAAGTDAYVTEAALAGASTSTASAKVPMEWTAAIPSVATAVVNGAYAVEFSLYALYFTDTLGYSATLTGTSQLAGDAVGALALLYVGSGARGEPSESPDGTVTLVPARAHPDLRRHWLLRQPYNLPMLFLVFGAQFMAFATPFPVLATIAQITMGTVYVFQMQLLNELSVLYSFGEERHMAVIALRNWRGYNIGAGLGSVIGTGLYESYGLKVPFWSTGIFVFVAAGVLSLTFRCRMAHLRKGIILTAGNKRHTSSAADDAAGRSLANAKGLDNTWRLVQHQRTRAALRTLKSMEVYHNQLSAAALLANSDPAPTTDFDGVPEVVLSFPPPVGPINSFPAESVV